MHLSADGGKHVVHSSVQADGDVHILHAKHRLQRSRTPISHCDTNNAKSRQMHHRRATQGCTSASRHINRTLARPFKFTLGNTSSQKMSAWLPEPLIDTLTRLL